MLGFLYRKATLPESITDALDGSFNDHEMRMIDRLSTTIDLQEGAHLTSEGTRGAEVMLLLVGTADVMRGGERIATVGRGEVVGETAVLTGAPRNATLIATEPVSVAVFNRREFSSLLAACPRLELVVRNLVDARS